MHIHTLHCSTFNSISSNSSLTASTLFVWELPELEFFKTPWYLREKKIIIVITYNTKEKKKIKVGK